MPATQHYPEPTVGALIFDPAGRLFLMRSHKWAGKYVVPGGHVELGETLEANR
jgi:nucleoside triphosphatase